MNATHKALILAGLHLAIVGSLGGKLLYDRMTRPRFWLKTVPVDPDTPLRGRYVSLRVEVPVTGAVLPSKLTEEQLRREPWRRFPSYDVVVHLQPRGNALVAERMDSQLRTWDPSMQYPHARLPERMRELPQEQWVVILNEPLAFFIPEHVPDPSLLARGEELWVEATLPKKGPLRPIRLAKKTSNAFTVLDL